MRSDSILTNLGNCSTGRNRRLWVEDSYSRLTNNGFDVGTGFTVEPRLGPGLNIRPAILASTHVSKRNGAAILSYEGSSNMARFSAPEVRVKLSYGLAQILPSLRVFSVRIATSETWTIEGAALMTPAGATVLRTGMERPPGRPTIIEARLNASNLVAATALIAWAKPETIRLTDPAPAAGQLDLFEVEAARAPTAATESDITLEVSRQFFVACGWTQQGPRLFRR
jgi:hypothetical protein